MTPPDSKIPICELPGISMKLFNHIVLHSDSSRAGNGVDLIQMLTLNIVTSTRLEESHSQTICLMIKMYSARELRRLESPRPHSLLVNSHTECLM